MNGLSRLGILVIMLIVVIVTTPTKVQAQEDDDLQIYGFTQLMYLYRMTDYTIEAGGEFENAYSQSFRSTTFSLHQVNLFFRKPINPRTTFFLNLEASGSYSSRTPSGYLEIPEGWISYNFNDYLEVKVGLLLPKFNNLTEIKNRLPLFPYLIRPILYESLVSSVFKSEDYRPDQAYFQIVYDRPISSQLIFNSAFYIGNSEDSFLARTEDRTITDLQLEERTMIYLGEDLNSAMLFGGRIGIENVLNTFKFGISGTLDEDNKNRIEESVFKFPSLRTPILGEVRRYRVGIDLSFTLSDKLAFEGEYLSAFHDHSTIHKTPAYKNANLNKFFVYNSLTYNINSQFYIFGGGSFSKDNTYEFVVQNSPDAAGLVSYNIGGGWKPIENTIIKAQLFKARSGQDSFLDYRVTFFAIGISTIF